MKKCKWISGLLAIVALGFVACGNTAGGETEPPKLTFTDLATLQENYSLDAYKKVTSDKMDIEIPAGKTEDSYNPDLYMVICNTGSTTVSADKYENIFWGSAKAGSRSIAEHNPKHYSIPEYSRDEDFSHYTCGLSIKQIRDADVNLNSTPSSRSIIFDTNGKPIKYDRTVHETATKLNENENFFIFYDEEVPAGVDDIDSVERKIRAKCVYANNDCQIFVENGIYYEENGEEKLDETNNYYDESNTSAFYTRTDESDWNTIKITQKGVKDIADKFSSICQKEQELFGKLDTLSNEKFNNTNIIEKSEKVTILISNIGAKGSNWLTFGYFYKSDLLCNTVNSRLPDGGFSNERLMFTLNTLAMSEEKTIYSTLGHEFNHMLNAINKWLLYRNNYNSWFTEMLSALTEDFTPDCLKIENTVRAERLPPFMKSASNGFINWKGDNYSYGYAYAFGSYLVRNYGGIQLIKDIATNEFVNEEAINKALEPYRETYESALIKFALALMNEDNISDYPSFNKDASGTINGGSYTYKYTPIDLYQYTPTISNFDINTWNETNPNNYSFNNCFDNPKWKKQDTLTQESDFTNNYKGPCFYSTWWRPASLSAGGFFITYLGKAKEWGHSLAFNPANHKDIQAYIFVKE